MSADRSDSSPRPAALDGSIRPTSGDSDRSLEAEIIVANAPDPVFVSDLEGKILPANDAVSQKLGSRPDEIVEQSLSKFISPEETREFTAGPDTRPGALELADDAPGRGVDQGEGCADHGERPEDPRGTRDSSFAVEG